MREWWKNLRKTPFFYIRNFQFHELDLLSKHRVSCNYEKIEGSFLFLLFYVLFLFFLYFIFVGVTFNEIRSQKETLSTKSSIIVYIPFICYASSSGILLLLLHLLLNEAEVLEFSQSVFFFSSFKNNISRLHRISDYSAFSSPSLSSLSLPAFYDLSAQRRFELTGALLDLPN